ncbi:MAG TPA: DinB family protein [Thermoanaerobaculia bacterium]|nr:DinB family protein [Thermoanaerobaculia bacterium]
MSPKEQFLDAYDREHAITMRIVKAYPKEKLDLKPHSKLKTARGLAWVFALECGLGTRVWHDEFAKGVPAGSPPKAPEDWNDLLSGLEKAYKDFRDLIASTPEAKLDEKVHFLTGPKTMGAMSRLAFAWFLLSDQIHHRGQFSIYLRMADAKVPSIYGPTADEPWM